MLTGTEKTSLALTCAFLALGGGVKAWQRAHVEWGPHSDDPAIISDPEAGSTGPAPLHSPPAYAELSLPPEPGSIPPQVVSGPGGPPASLAWDSGETPESEPETPFMEQALPVDVRLGIAADRPVEIRSRHRARQAKGRSIAARKTPPAGKVSLNHATAADLAEIPGIGPKTALAILEYRRAHGLFLDLDELVHVKGIGEKKLERIARYLMLSPVVEEEPLRQAQLPEPGDRGLGMEEP